MKPLSIAFVSPEAVPYVKTGGLADVSGTLPLHLANAGHRIRLFLPYYRTVKENFPRATSLNTDISIPVGPKKLLASYYQIQGVKSGLNIIFIACDPLFDRSELYRDPKTGKDWDDNDERFIFFSRAVIEFLRVGNDPPNIIHCNDWQTALIPAYLKTVYRDDPLLKTTRTVFTIHNMGYKGEFPAAIVPKLGMESKLFDHPGPFEYWGMVSFMKAAILLADHITTVSPTYSREIQSGSEFGMGLEGVLESRRDALTGILNGVDYDTWSPQKDKLIPFRYFPANLSGKKKNKLVLLERSGLALRPEWPLIGMISRLDNQKGFDLIAEIFDRMMQLPMQFILLGTGDEKYHRFFTEKAAVYSDRFKPYLGFDNNLAHLIEAGADLFLMPSRYEPCGLNQMYSLKYGTMPIVRKTGGLADTVVDIDEATGAGTGLVFEPYDSPVLLDTISRAVDLFARKRLWYKVVKRGMVQDFSWKRSALAYLDLYQRLTLSE